MVFRSKAIQAGWHFDQDDAIIDNSSIGSTCSTNRKENTTKNDSDQILRKILAKTTNTRKGNNHTDEEGWTTTTPGRTKPKNSNTVASTESIITTMEGNFETIDLGTPTKISVQSSDRSHKCNIPETTKIVSTAHKEFNPCITQQTKNTGKGTQQDNKEQETEGQDKNNNKETRNSNTHNNTVGEEGKDNEKEQDKKDKEHTQNTGVN
jgi:hypothetical protein